VFVGLEFRHSHTTDVFCEWLLYPWDGWNVKAGIIDFLLAMAARSNAGENQGRLLRHYYKTPSLMQAKAYPLFGPIELNHYEIGKLTEALGDHFSTSACHSKISRPNGKQRAASPTCADMVSVAQDYQDGSFPHQQCRRGSHGRKPLTVEQFVDINRDKFAM